MKHSQTKKSKKDYEQINFLKNVKEVALFWTFGRSSIVMLLWR